MLELPSNHGICNFAYLFSLYFINCSIIFQPIKVPDFTLNFCILDVVV